jgi:transcription termination factor Rho
MDVTTVFVLRDVQYYGHRAKMQIIDREDEVEKLNREALRIAKRVAERTNTLMAGNISNTTVYQPNNQEAAERVHNIFKVSGGYRPRSKFEMGRRRGRNKVYVSTSQGSRLRLKEGAHIKVQVQGWEGVRTFSRLEQIKDYG